MMVTLCPSSMRMSAKEDDHFSTNSLEASVVTSAEGLVWSGSVALGMVEQLMGEDGITPGGGEREAFWVGWKFSALGFRD